jgi:phosphatidylserine/phosphatidylglycerophosphate/cardiolipin synthase-like enzyme
MVSSSRATKVDDAELVGGVLIDATDPRQAAHQLADLLLAPRPDRIAATHAGLHPDLVEALRARIGDDSERVMLACHGGAAWVLGRRSVAVGEPWDLVASLPSGTALPPGLRRTTGETLVQLVAQATDTLRLAAPFIDRVGLSFIGDALAAATTRGVDIEILLPTRSTHADDALGELETTIRHSGTSANFRVSRLRFDAPWAHLKVMTSDSIAAYIGSANVTGAGIAGHNLELGVLVRGPAVVVVEQILDQYRAE